MQKKNTGLTERDNLNDKKNIALNPGQCHTQRILPLRSGLSLVVQETVKTGPSKA